VSTSANGPRSVPEKVADAIRALILAGELEPGEKLPPFTELAATYGASQQKVNEAIALLKDEGLIVTLRGSGTFVATDLPAGGGERPAPELPEEYRAILDLLADIKAGVDRIEGRMERLEGEAGETPSDS
jgi:DNA-binding FadR family transcriptional regulator